MGIGLSIAGLATSVAGSVGSFTQAAKQRQAAKEAAQAAAKSIKEARKRLDVNAFETLAVTKEPYRQAQEAANVVATDAVQRLQEGDPRGLAAGVGRINQANLEAQGGIRSSQEEQILGLDKLVAGETMRLADMGYNLDLAEAEGAQAAAANSSDAQQQALSQGMAGLVGVGAQAASMPALYNQMDARGLERLKADFGESGTFDYALRNVIGEEKFQEYNSLTGLNRDSWLLQNQDIWKGMKELSSYSGNLANMRSPYLSGTVGTNTNAPFLQGASQNYGGLVGK